MNKEQAMTKQPSFLAKAAEKLLKNKLAALCFVLLVLEVPASYTHLTLPTNSRV